MWVVTGGAGSVLRLVLFSDRDGLLFLNKQGHYDLGITPLVQVIPALSAYALTTATHYCRRVERASLYMQ